MKKVPLISTQRIAGFTMVELLITVVIIAILAGFLFPVVGKMKSLADVAVCVSNLRQVTSATMIWAADHGDKLPSPQYSSNEDNLPIYWNLDTDGEEGLWLNGVVFAQIYIESQLADSPDDIVEAPKGGNRAQAGAHLMGTVFESRVSTLKNPSELDWYRHSFAMNANLEYDELAELRNLSDPYYSEKALSKFEPAKAMLYIDCAETNVVMADDYEYIMDAAEERYDGKRLLVSFIGGHVQKMIPNDIPDGSIETDREASLFWRGVMPKR